MSYAVAILCISPEGIPLVRDPRKPHPLFWKLPGGKAEGEETPEEAARRELGLETGIWVPEDHLILVDQQDRGSHIVYIFNVAVPDLDGLVERGDEGEEVQVFSAEDIIGMSDFFLPHRDAVGELLVQIL